MRAIDTLGRRTLCLQTAWAANGTGITGAVAALFIAVDFPGRASSDNNYYDLRNARESQYS